MTQLVLFVHGTGVRQADYNKTMLRVKTGMAKALPGAHVEPCLWGDPHGSRLACKGVSIPDFSGEPPSDADASGLTALWQLLSMEPTFELRELTGVAQPTGLRQLAALERVPDDVRALGTSAKALAQLPPAEDVAARDGLWAASCDAIAASETLAELLKVSRVVDGRLRTAVGRACVAQWQASTGSAQGGVLPDRERDVLVGIVTDILGGADKFGAADWVRARFRGMALRWATDKARRERDVLFNAAYPVAGDILLYQSDGQAIRDFIGTRIDACPGDVIVMAHSLGGIACVDLLLQHPREKVKALVTLGSQAPLLYELGALRFLKPPQRLPDTFPKRWLNFYDRDDLLSYRAAPLFGVARDIEVRSGQPFPDSHSAYWNQQAVWDRLKAELA